MSSPQTQIFAYANIYRLTNAQASGGSGVNYGPDSYTYSIDTGNLTSKAGIAYYYDNSSHKHAVTSLSNGWSYQYDANGNMTQRNIPGSTVTLTYDMENHLAGVSDDVTAAYAYDGDGKRITATQGVTTTVYVGNYFELSISGGITSTVKYYYAGGSRIAMRQNNGAVKWLLGDHLGSASVAANSDGSLSSRQGYKAWGETRFGSLPTKYQYTGQMNEQSLGLYYYGARWYDASLGRFVQPDILVPYYLNPNALDRYTYALNNPIRYNDPSGYCSGDPGDKNDTEGSECWRLYNNFPRWYPNVHLSNHSDWSTSQLTNLFVSLKLVRNAFGGQKAFSQAFGSFKVFGPGSWVANQVESLASGMAPPFLGMVILTNSLFTQGKSSVIFDIIHELGHRFDFHNKGIPYAYYSQKFINKWGKGCDGIGLLGCSAEGSGAYSGLSGTGYNPNSDETTPYGATNSTDDFAESFSAAILRINDIPLKADWLTISRERINYVIRLINSY